jgi:hypothetical protein
MTPIDAIRERHQDARRRSAKRDSSKRAPRPWKGGLDDRGTNRSRTPRRARSKSAEVVRNLRRAAEVPPAGGSSQDSKTLDAALEALREIAVEGKLDGEARVRAARILDRLAIEDARKRPRRAEFAVMVADALAFSPSELVTPDAIEPIRLAYRVMLRPFVSERDEEHVLIAFLDRGWTVDAVLEETPVMNLLDEIEG